MENFIQLGLSPEDEQLKQKLLSHKILTASEFQSHWSGYQKAHHHILSHLKGTLCYIDANAILHIREFPDNEPLGSFTLTSDIVETEKQACPVRELAFFTPTEGELADEIKLTKTPLMGLIYHSESAFLYYPGFEKNAYLGQTYTLLDKHGPGSKRPHFDMYLSKGPHYRYLLVNHREKAEITIIDLDKKLKVHHQIITENPSGKPLNIAFDITRRERTVFITDNHSQFLYILDLLNLYTKTWASGIGTLGNLCLTPDRKHLYFFTLSPKLSLKYFEKEKLKTLRTLKVKGISSTEAGYHGQDLIHLSPDGACLLSQSFLPTETGPAKPVIQMIDAQEVKTLKRFSLKTLIQPDQLLWTEKNPITDLSYPSLKDYLLTSGTITEADIAAISTDPQKQGDTPSPQKQAPPKLRPLAPTIKKSPEQAKFVPHQPPDYDKAILKDIDKEGEPLLFSVEADMVILQLFVWHFYQVTLTNLEVHPTEIFKLRKVANKTRKRLENKLAVWVRIPAILGKYTFELPISRKMVQQLLEKYKQRGAKGFHLNLCPECRYPMEDEDNCPQCPVCHLALDLPAEKAWRRDSSADASVSLPPGQFLLPLHTLQKVLIITPWHQLLESFSGQSAHLKSLGDAVVLPNQNLLITDTLGKYIGEFKLTGECLWKSRVPLQKPVSATYYVTENFEERFLIVDADQAQIIELNRKGKIQRQFPLMDTPESNRLKNPRGIQRTPEDHWIIVDEQRVLEIDARGQTISIWDKKQGIEKPIFARRTPQNLTEIIDQATQRLLVFDAEEQCVESLKYWPPEDVKYRGEKAPQTVMRLHSGDYLFSAPQFYLILNPQNRTYRGPYPIPEDVLEEDRLVKLRVMVGERSIDKQKRLQERIDILKKAPLLKEVSEKQLITLAEGLRAMRFTSGDTVMPDMGKDLVLYFVLEGQIQIWKGDVPIFTVGPGDILGGIAMVLSSKIEAEARAETNCRVFQLDHASFKKVILHFPRFFHILRSQALEHQRFIRRYQDEKSQAMTEQLAFKLMLRKVKEHPIFAEGQPEFYRAMARVLRPVAFMPDQVIYSRGESSGTLYFINQGEVGLLRKGERKPQICLKDGDLFGEMALFSQEKRVATVVTQDYSRFYELDYQDLQPILAKQNWLKKKLDKIIAKRRAKNRLDLAAFEKKMGLTRPNLPKAHIWHPIPIYDESQIYIPMRKAAFIVGLDQWGDLLLAAGLEPNFQFENPTRLTIHQDTAYICDPTKGAIFALDLVQRKIKHIWRQPDSNEFEPQSAMLISEDQLLVTDEFNSRLLCLNQTNRIVWEYTSPHPIMNPVYAEETIDGNLLFVDKGLQQVMEINRQGELLWSYGKLMISGDGPGELCDPHYAHRLPYGETLIADTGNDRLLLINQDGKETAVYYGTESHPLSAPYHCEIMANGDILVFSQTKDCLIRLDRWGDPIWQVNLNFVQPPKALDSPLTESAADREETQNQTALSNVFSRIGFKSSEPTNHQADIPAQSNQVSPASSETLMDDLSLDDDEDEFDLEQFNL